MVTDLLLRQAYRLYAAMLAIWGGWSLVWTFLPVDMATATIGYGWLVIAALGVPVTAGLVASRSTLFDVSTLEAKRFEANSFSGAPLVAYAVALVVWSAVFAVWSTAGLAVNATVVGYGWLAIAAYGAVLTIGLVSTHRAEVLAAVGVRTPDDARM